MLERKRESERIEPVDIRKWMNQGGFDSVDKEDDDDRGKGKGIKMEFPLYFGQRGKNTDTRILK